jgi:alpha-L-fucosidase
VHILKNQSGNITLENFPYKKISKAWLLKDGTKIVTVLRNGQLTLTPASWNEEEPDQVIVLEVHP